MCHPSTAREVDETSVTAEAIIESEAKYAPAHGTRTVSVSREEMASEVIADTRRIMMVDVNEQVAQDKTDAPTDAQTGAEKVLPETEKVLLPETSRSA